MSNYTVQENMCGQEFIEDGFFCVKDRINKQKSLKKTIAKDRRVRNQLKLVRHYDGFKVRNKVGVFSKRSLKINTKKIQKTPFKTTNLGKKRMNSRSFKERFLNYEDLMLEKHVEEKLVL